MGNRKVYHGGSEGDQLQASMEKEAREEEDLSQIKQFVLQNLGKVPKEVLGVIEKTGLESIISAPLRSGHPLNVLWPGAIYKENLCVAGEALHRMTPDIGQGGCAALEDGVVLARCLSEVFPRKQTKEKTDDEEEYKRMRKGIKKFAKERKWRSFELIATSYIVGMLQQSNGNIMNFFRDKFLSSYLAGLLLKKSDFDCGKLTSS
ncbi:hypothetical protein IFM89_004884 [Coptis chinensis]|uniref:Uncharacterized protein n=1 Tax=Coptis chinensis TaxID=261450 RepID=A0A835LTW6_9MAGN|nr:hypothetical protein IFM89_004884 [Coptis chinensis]